jgi:putative transposase
VEQERADHRVARMCRVLGVSPSGYYAWRKRGLSRRRREDAALLERVRRIWEGSGRTYGAPRVWAELRAGGVRCSRKRVARLMREAGLVGAYPRRRRRKTTVQDPRAAAAPDLVGRQFRAEGPNRLWVADLVYVPTQEGVLYLSCGAGGSWAGRCVQMPEPSWWRWRCGGAGLPQPWCATPTAGPRIRA